MLGLCRRVRLRIGIDLTLGRIRKVAGDVPGSRQGGITEPREGAERDREAPRGRQGSQTRGQGGAKRRAGRGRDTQEAPLGRPRAQGRGTMKTRLHRFLKKC